MYGAFAVALPLLWAGALDGQGVMTVGHVGMFVLMLVAMLWRWDEYAHHHDGHEKAEAAVTLTSS